MKQEPDIAWEDSRLVQACIKGDEDAWATLIEKYKRLIYSVPLKYRAAPEDAADIFQAVCMELFSGLQNLRNVESLRGWLLTVAAHESLRWKKRQRIGDVELDDTGDDHQVPELGDPQPLAPELLQQIEREQGLREAIARLAPRCAAMVRLLFYEDPPVPYAELATRLSLATGSIGFIRGRCLNKLRTILVEMEF